MDWVSGAFLQQTKRSCPLPLTDRASCTARAHRHTQQVQKFTSLKEKKKKSTNQRKKTKKQNPTESLKTLTAVVLISVSFLGRKKKKIDTLKLCLSKGQGKPWILSNWLKRWQRFIITLLVVRGRGRSPCCALPQKERGEPCFPLPLSLCWSVLGGGGGNKKKEKEKERKAGAEGEKANISREKKFWCQIKVLLGGNGPPSIESNSLL